MFLGLSEPLRESINSTEDIQAQLEAQDVLVNELLSKGAIQADSLEEAQEIVSAKDSALAQELKEREEKSAREEAQDKENHAKMAAAWPQKKVA